MAAFALVAPGPDPRDERIEALEAEVAELRRQLGVEHDTETTARLVRMFAMPRGPALMLQVLLSRRGRLVTYQFLDDYLPTVDAVAERANYRVLGVYAYQIRARMGAASLITERGIGYRLSLEAVNRIERALEARS